MINFILALLGLKKGHGFNSAKEKIKIDHWLFGAGNLPNEILRPDGQWDAYLPEKELQNINGVETWSCPVFGTLNCIETLIRAKYGLMTNWAERFIAILSNIRYGVGGSPHEAAEQIRNKGNVAQALLPFDSKITSWTKFMSPKPMTQDFLDEGKKWFDNYQFNHEWLTDLSTSGIKNALRYSPLGIGVYAWWQNGEYFDKPQGRNDNHWVECYGYVEGKYWKVYDHYDNVHKRLAWNYDFKFAKRYWVGMKDQKNVVEGNKLLDRLEDKFIIRAEANGELYKVTRERLVYGVVYISLQDLRDEVNNSLRKLDNFVGISEKDFANLSMAVIAVGGTIDKPINLDNLINK